MNSSEDALLNFNGLSGAECEAFVQAVRRHAFSARKTRDMEYMADYAAMCMAGSALRWFDELDSDTQTDWNRLRLALLAKYPRDFHADSQSTPVVNVASALIPTPAAAPPSRKTPVGPPSTQAAATSMKDLSALSLRDIEPSGNDVSGSEEGSTPSHFRSSASFVVAAPPPPPQGQAAGSLPRAPMLPISQPFHTSPRRGRIIVVIRGAVDGSKRYISAKLNFAQFYECTANPLKALQVEYQPLIMPFPIQVSDPATKVKDVFGITQWYAPEGKKVPQDLGPTSVLRGALGPVKDTPSNQSTPSSSEANVSGRVLWTIDDSGIFSATWKDGRVGGYYPLDVMFMGDWLYLAGNADSFIKSGGGTIFQNAHLVFESV